MAAPVGNRSAISQAQPAAPVQGRAAAGVGEAPTTLQSAAPQLQAKGYIERLVIAIKDLIVMIFSKIFSCFRQPEPAPLPPLVTPIQPPQPQAQPAADPHAREREMVNRLRSMVRNEDLLRCFDTYFPTDADKEPIYLRLGQLVPQSFMSNFWRESYNRAQRIQAGKNMVQQDPTLIISHIVQRIEARIQS